MKVGHVDMIVRARSRRRRWLPIGAATLASACGIEEDGAGSNPSTGTRVMALCTGELVTRGPLTAVGPVWSRMGGCTGTLVSPIHVVTAAHC